MTGEIITLNARPAKIVAEGATESGRVITVKGVTVPAAVYWIAVVVVGEGEKR